MWKNYNDATMNTLDLNKSLEYAQEKLKELRDTVTSNPAYVAAAEKATAHIATARAAVAAGTKDVSSHVQNASLALSSFTSDTSAALSAKATEAFASAKEALVAASNAVAQFADQAVKRALRAVSDLDQKYQVQDKVVAAASQLDAKFNLVSNAKALDEKYAIMSTATAIATKAQEIGDSITGARVTPAVEYIATQAYAAGAQLQDGYLAAKQDSPPLSLCSKKSERHAPSWRPHRGV